MPVLFANGMFNYVDPVLHLQIYIWGWVLLMVLTAISAIIHHFARWKPLAPFHGLYYEYKNGGNAAFIFDGDLRGEMVAERTAKCIFDYSKVPYILPTDNVPVLGKLYRWIFYYPTAYEGVHIDFVHALVYKFGGVNKDVEIARALQNGEWERNPSVICAGVPVDIIIDTDSWTIPHSRQHKAIESAADMWNETNPTDQIHSYSKFQKYLLEGKIACDGIKRESLCEWVRIDGSLPTDLKDNEFAGKKMQMAITADEIDSRFLNGLGIKVLVGGIGFGALLIVARLMTTFLM
jgi:hypothetical protein